MSELGSIYGTTNIDGSNTLVIDFSNVQINGTLKLPVSNIIFNGVYDNVEVNSGSFPTVETTKCITGFNSNRVPPIGTGTGWDLTNGIFTAPRDCYMCFNFTINIQLSGTNASEAVILHRRGLVAPFTYEYIHAISVQNTNSQIFEYYNLTGVFFVLAGEIVRVGIRNPTAFGAFSGGRNSAVSFSGYNID